MDLMCFPCRLVCGDVEGRFSAVFKRVSGILKKNGPFDVSPKFTFYNMGIDRSNTG